MRSCRLPAAGGPPGRCLPVCGPCEFPSLQSGFCRGLGGGGRCGKNGGRGTRRPGSQWDGMLCLPERQHVLWSWSRSRSRAASGLAGSLGQALSGRGGRLGLRNVASWRGLLRRLGPLGRNRTVSGKLCAASRPSGGWQRQTGAGGHRRLCFPGLRSLRPVLRPRELPSLPRLFPGCGRSLVHPNCPTLSAGPEPAGQPYGMCGYAAGWPHPHEPMN